MHVAKSNYELYNKYESGTWTLNKRSSLLNHLSLNIKWTIIKNWAYTSLPNEAENFFMDFSNCFNVGIGLIYEF